MAKREFSAIVPVAGNGVRLRPHTHTYPKVLLTVGDKPIIGHILDELSRAGVKKIYMIIGYMGDKVKAYVSEKYHRLDVTYIVQDEPKGLGHAIWTASDYVKGPALVILGDTIISADLRKFMNAREDAIAVREVEDPRRFGVVEIKGGRITGMVEKPAHPVSKMAIVGLYAFQDSKLLFQSLDRLIKSGNTTKGEIQLTDAMRLMMKGGHKFVPVDIDGWYDCGKPETLLETNRYILKKKKPAYHAPGCTVVEPVYISPSAKVTNSIIGPYASIGDGVTMDSSIVSDSIINENAVIENMNLNRSLIGPSATVIGRREQINIGENSEIRFDKTGCEL